MHASHPYSLNWNHMSAVNHCRTFYISFSTVLRKYLQNRAEAYVVKDYDLIITTPTDTALSAVHPAHNYTLAHLHMNTHHH